MRYSIASLLVAGVLASPVVAAPTVFTSAAAFAAATTGVTTNGFEGVPTGQSRWILQNGPYVQPGFTITQTSSNAFNTDPAATSYYYNWGTGDVINTPYSGTLTVTFAAPVTAFALDLGTFYSLPFPFPAGVTPGAATTRYGVPVTVGTSQGSFTVATNTTQNFAFFGLTSNVAFTSFTLSAASAAPAGTSPSIVFDNLQFGAAVVPEPATWGLMIVGFGLVGASLRGRRGATLVRG